MSQKIKLTLRKHIKPWQFYDDPNVKINSNTKHLGCIQRMNSALGFPTDRFYFKRYDSQETYDRVVQFLYGEHTDRHKKTFTFSDESRRSYINALLKFLGQTPDDISMAIYTKYMNLGYTVKKEVEHNRPEKEYIDFAEIEKKLQGVISNPRNVNAIRVICLFLKYNIGAFRPSDLQNTRLIETNDYSYLDINNKVWHIKGDCTKNGQARTIDLPPEFITELQAVLPEQSSHLLLDKALEPYLTLSSISSIIYRQLGYTFNEIRSSYVQRLHSTQNCSVSKAGQTASDMGHSIRTAAVSYNK
jgi:hypothetical protein